MPIMECGYCDKPLATPEATGYTNQYDDKITITVKPEKTDSLATHLHNGCRLSAKAKPRIIVIASNLRGKGPLGIVR